MHNCIHWNLENLEHKMRSRNWTVTHQYTLGHNVIEAKRKNGYKCKIICLFKIINFK